MVMGVFNNIWSNKRPEKTTFFYYCKLINIYIFEYFNSIVGVIWISRTSEYRLIKDKINNFTLKITVKTKMKEVENNLKQYNSNYIYSNHWQSIKISECSQEYARFIYVLNIVFFNNDDQRGNNTYIKKIVDSNLLLFQ